MSSVERRSLFIVLYATVFLISMAIGTAMMLMPVEANGMGASLLEIGLMGTAAAAGYTLMTFVAGSLLDRLEKLRLYLAFNLFATLGLAMLFYAGDLAGLWVARIMIGLAGGAFWTSAGALTADLSPPELLTHAIGRYNLSWIVGFTIGPLFGGAIADIFGFSALWAILIAIMLVGVGLNAFALIPKIRLSSSSKNIKFDFDAVYGLRYAYITMIPYALGLGIYFYILPGYMADIGISATVIGLLLAASSAVKGAGFYYSERIVSFGTRRGLVLGSIMIAASLVAVGYAKTEAAFILPLVLFGASNGLIEPLLMNSIAHGSPKASLGTTMGVYEGMYGAFTCISPIAAGYFTEAFSASTIYVALAAISFLMIPMARKIANEKEV